MRGPRGLRAAVLLLFAGALPAACTTLERNPEVAGTYSEKLSPYNYKEDGRLVSMVVGVEAARFIRNEPYVPLFVQVANKTKTTLIVTRESFVLEDPLGRQYPLAPAQEVAEKYRRLDLDRRLFFQNRAITTVAVGVYTYISSNFFPSTSRRALLVDQISLPPIAYLEDVLYFPIPETGLNGVTLRLIFKVKDLAEPIQVVFEVPKTIGILEKEDKERP